MKTNIKKFLLLTPFFSIWSLTANCQLLASCFRGHNNNDLYIYTANENPYNGRSLLYMEENGSIIHVQNKTEIITSSHLTAETIPGKIVGHSSSFWGYSTDYGKTFLGSYPYVNYYTSFNLLHGGSIPGEYITQGEDISLYPYPKRNVIYKTTDYGLHYTLIADSSSSLWYAEIGLISGEIYQMPIINSHAFFCHSLDFGATFDTIPVSTTIINGTSGIMFHSLSRGTAQGELFLITKKTVSATEIHYSIYHTADYGASWQLKSTHVFDSDRQQFTAGRGACNFYIANLKTIPSSTYYKLQILYSADCGVTFTSYEHVLTPDVGIKETGKAENDISISPNPATDQISLTYNLLSAEKITVQLFTMEGKLIETLVNENQSPGLQSIAYNCSKLQSGIYTLVLSGENGTIKTGKLAKLK